MEHRENRDLNILLITPKSYALWGNWPIQQVGIAYVSAYLKEKGYRVFTLNLNCEIEDSATAIRRYINKYKINFVGTGGLVSEFAAVKDIVDCVKAIDDSIITLIGNGLVTYSAKEAMEGIDQADIGVIGEGEITVAEVIQTIMDNQDLASVPGIVYRKTTGELCFTSPRSPIDNLDILPFPDWDGFRWFDNSVQRSVESNGKKVTVAPLVTSRGCPFSCTYCCKSGGGGYRQRSLDNIFAEIDILVNNKKVNRFFLDDELFAVKADRVFEFCERIRAYNVQWLVFLRVGRHMTTELLQCMKDSGCVCIFYGIESGSNTVLKSMRKGINVEEICATLLRTDGVGIPSRGSLIFGDIVETQETIKESLIFARQFYGTNIYITLNMITLYPGSHLYNTAIREGRIKQPLEFIKAGCPLVNMSQLSDAEYDEFSTVELPNERLKNVEYVLSRTPPLKLEEIFGDRRGNKQYRFTLECQKCGAKVDFVIYPPEVNMSYDVACPQCGRVHACIPMKGYATYVNEQLGQILSKESVALWGAGSFLQMFYKESMALRQHPWLQIDGEEKSWGKTKNDRKVFSPDTIEKENCTTVIISAPRRSYDIEAIIHKTQPGIKKILRLWELA